MPSTVDQVVTTSVSSVIVEHYSDAIAAFEIHKESKKNLRKGLYVSYENVLHQNIEYLLKRDNAKKLSKIAYEDLKSFSVEIKVPLDQSQSLEALTKKTGEVMIQRYTLLQVAIMHNAVRCIQALAKRLPRE